MFKEGRDSVEDEPRAGRPSTSRTAENEQRVRHLQNMDRRLSVSMIAEQLGMDKMVAHKIISEDLGMRKICAKLVPKVLMDVQKPQYDPETKRQSNEWYTRQSPRQKKARMSKSKMKEMLIVFYDKNGAVFA
ncbi:HTH_48 domain-containing protein [Trichonephila clavipes]|nr:HTH_48 domain-containing protein [Trichonephila clavipes]